MNQFYPKLDPKTGRFLPTPPGEKTEKIKAMEKILGVQFEDDYKEKYLNGKIGQQLFSKRWKSSKSNIFSSKLPGGRKSWIQMLNLPKRNTRIVINNLKIKGDGCEICGKDFPLVKAHWRERVKDGSTKYYNILNICPNCHVLLDSNDDKTIELGREALLSKVVKKLLDTIKDEKTLRKELVEKCSEIINNRK